MAIATSRIRKGTWGALSPLLLCGAMQGQTEAAKPVAPTAAPSAAPTSLSALHLARLPDTTALLPTAMASASQPLHVLVGRSIFIVTESRLRRVYVSNPEVVDSFTSTTRQIVVTAKAPGVSSLILWDEAGR